jgi:uncharacterized membrane protein (UPF0136 family)
MKALAVVGYILAVLVAIGGLLASLEQPTPAFLLSGVAAGLMLALLSTLVLGLGQIKQILLVAHGIEKAKVYDGGNYVSGYRKVPPMA